MTPKDALRGKFYPTAVGSLPYKDPKTACEKILSNLKDIPFWPQLIKRSFLENMYVQFSEGLPGAVVDREEKRIYIDTGRDLSRDIEKVYEKFLANDIGYFSISREYAQGLYEMVDMVKGASSKPVFLKGQITGPISFGLTVVDDKKRSIFYNTELKEALLKILSMKARWQIKKLKETGVDCIFFIDEPYLASIGSSFINIKKEEAISCLNEIIQAVHSEGALCGIHCCGNTDWGLILSTDIDILNFDAYNFCDSIALYPKELGAFLQKGGLLAWGIVLNTPEVIRENKDSIIGALQQGVEALAKKGINKKDIFDSMLITPSCGLGLVDEYISDIVIKDLLEVSGELRRMKN